MLCTINDFYLADGTISGGWSLTGLRLKMDRIFDTVIPVPSSQQEGLLIVGMGYRIAVYVVGDDFTNVGGVNVEGDVFAATGTTPTDWTNGSVLVALSPVLLDRNKRKAEISFTVGRIHATITDAENYINLHEFTVPRTGDIKLLAMESIAIPSGVVALVINGVLLSHELIKYIGKYTEHQYNIVGSPLFAPTPEADHLVTEGGDTITTEGGDALIVE